MIDKLFIRFILKLLINYDFLSYRLDVLSKEK